MNRRRHSQQQHLTGTGTVTTFDRHRRARKIFKVRPKHLTGTDRDATKFQSPTTTFNRHRQNGDKIKKNKNCRRRRVRLKRTNLRVEGLSLNRSQKWTALLSTTPRLRPRSSTNDLAPLRSYVVAITFGTRTRQSESAKSRCAVALPPRGPKSVATAYIVACRRRGTDGIVAIVWTGF